MNHWILTWNVRDYWNTSQHIVRSRSLSLTVGQVKRAAEFVTEFDCLPISNIELIGKDLRDDQNWPGGDIVNVKFTCDGHELTGTLSIHPVEEEEIAEV